MKKIITCYLLVLILLSINNVVFAGNNFKLPDYKKYVLKNGLTIYLMEQHEVALVYISAVFAAGSVKDKDNFGLASLTADGLLFGTKNYTKKQIEETLDYIGASYGTSASKEFSQITMSFVNTDHDQVLPIFRELIMNPVFDEQEFKKMKKRLLVNLERSKERPAQVIRSYYERFLFNEHVYGNPVKGNIETVTNISVNDLKEFYKANYYPAGAAIAVVGDFKIKEMKSKIKELFANWNNEGGATTQNGTSIPSFNKNRLLLINKDDATETRFLIGSHGIKRSNADYVAIQVINTVLGGRFTSWLNDELRVNRGLTYGAYSFFSPFKNSGIFAMASFTQTENTIEALDVTLDVLNKLHNEGIDEETLSSAKNYVKGQFPPRYETAGSLASLLTSMYVYDFDQSYINDFQKNVDGLTVEKAKVIVKKYFPSDNLQFVLIGKASEIRDSVKKYGELSEKEIKDVGF